MILCVRTQAERQTVRRDKYFCEAVSRDGRPACTLQNICGGLCRRSLLFILLVFVCRHG